MMKSIKLNDDDLILIIGILENRADSENKDVFLIDQIAFLVDELKTQSENK
mgnify:CR=1 FL=1